MDWSDVMVLNEKSFWGFIGFELISATKESVELGLQVEDRHLNYKGIVHGGVLTALMDQAMGVLVCMMRIDGTQGVTTNLNVTFLTAMQEGKLVATAHLIHETFRSMTMQAEVRNEEGVLVSIATATFRLPKPSV